MADERRDLGGVATTDVGLAEKLNSGEWVTREIAVSIGADWEQAPAIDIRCQPEGAPLRHGEAPRILRAASMAAATPSSAHR